MISGEILTYKQAKLRVKRSEFQDWSQAVFSSSIWGDNGTAGGGETIGVGNFNLEIGYLHGAARGKNGSADALVGLLVDTPHYSVAVMECADYLSPPSVTDEWKNVSRRVKFENIRTMRPDLAGADLMTRFMETEEVGFLAQVLRNDCFEAVLGNRRGLSDSRTGRRFPFLEVGLDTVLRDWLIIRNQYRAAHVERIIESLNPGERWRNYWMNAAIGVVGVLVDKHHSDLSRNGLTYAWGYIRSLADLRIHTSSEHPYLSSPLKGITDPVYIDTDVNGLFDSLAKRGGLAGAGGLTSLETYHKKTAPDGVYMVWGPTTYERQLWERLALARSEKVLGSGVLEQPEEIGVATDGFYNLTRDPGRESRSEIYWRRWEQLNRPEKVFEDILDNGGPTDDFLGVKARLSLVNQR